MIARMTEVQWDKWNQFKNEPTVEKQIKRLDSQTRSLVNAWRRKMGKKEV